jgi:hypothetical protein
MAIAYTRTSDRVRVIHTDDPAYTGEGDGIIPAPANVEGLTVFEIRPLNNTERQRGYVLTSEGQIGEALALGVVAAHEDGTRTDGDDLREYLEGIPHGVAADLFRAIAAVSDGPFPLHRLSSSKASPATT